MFCCGCAYFLYCTEPTLEIFSGFCCVSRVQPRKLRCSRVKFADLQLSVVACATTASLILCQPTFMHIPCIQGVGYIALMQLSVQAVPCCTDENMKIFCTLLNILNPFTNRIPFCNGASTVSQLLLANNFPFTSGTNLRLPHWYCGRIGKTGWECNLQVNPIRRGSSLWKFLTAQQGPFWPHLSRLSHVFWETPISPHRVVPCLLRSVGFFKKLCDATAE